MAVVYRVPSLSMVKVTLLNMYSMPRRCGKHQHRAPLESDVLFPLNDRDVRIAAKSSNPHCALAKREGRRKGQRYCSHTTLRRHVC